MTALHQKLARDVLRMWSQVLTIALVVASGVGGYITSLSAVDSLALARDDFYARAHFADVFATLKRAPLSVRGVLRELPGVADVQTTVESLVRITLPGLDDPVVGHLIGLNPREPQTMNQVSLRQGRWLSAQPAQGEVIDALISEGFADVRGLKPGDVLSANINGRRRLLRMVGTALSPEYVFAGMQGMPDLRGFGVFWVDHDTLAGAYDMQGAFNRVAIKLAPHAFEPEVLESVKHVLAPYGGRDAVGREHQSSHAMLNNEIQEQHVLGTILPAIFLGVAAFLLNVVLSRLIAMQREQIAALKALGYTNRAVAVHYLQWVLVIIVLGLLLGVGAGVGFGRWLTGVYAEFFRFPRFDYQLAPSLVWVAAGVSVLTAVAGTLNAVGATVRLSPAQAMQAPAPGRYRPTLLERLGLQGMPLSLRMILRHMERRPWRTTLSITGMASAVALVVMGNFFRDAVDHIVSVSFDVAMRSDVMVWLPDPMDDAVRLDLARLPGVFAVEAGRMVAVRFFNGQYQHRGAIQGVAQQGELRRVIDIDGHEATLPMAGLLISDRLADKLRVRPGQHVAIELLEGQARTLTLPVGGVVRDMMGLNAWLPRTILNTLLHEGDVSNQYALALTPGSEPAFLRATQLQPHVVGVFSKSTVRRNMSEVSARNIRIMSGILTAFAVVIAVGVVYNQARVALAEGTWELASLRVLGFTRAEVSAFLLGELALAMLVALPLGMALGWGLTHSVVDLLKNEQFAFPVVISTRTYAWAALCVVVAGGVSAWIVRRRIDQLDLVAALKTRE
jgi:putative ABC transport system permease protein